MVQRRFVVSYLALVLRPRSRHHECQGVWHLLRASMGPADSEVEEMLSKQRWERINPAKSIQYGIVTRLACLTDRSPIIRCSVVQLRNPATHVCGVFLYKRDR
jgi:hypothetical protein